MSTTMAVFYASTSLREDVRRGFASVLVTVG
jgi:hypothetical protein